MEVTERLAGNVPVASGLELTATSVRPVVPENRPRPILRLRLEVHLDEFAGGVATHHYVEEHLTGRRLEQVRVVHEGDINAASVFGIGMDNVVVASRKRCIHRGDKKVEHKAVLDFAHTEKVRTSSTVHLRDDRRELGNLFVAAGRSPAGKVGAYRSLQLLRPAGGVLLVEEVLKIPPRHVIS